jgi:hypothetical protein
MASSMFLLFPDVCPLRSSSIPSHFPSSFPSSKQHHSHVCLRYCTS